MILTDELKKKIDTFLVEYLPEEYKFKFAKLGNLDNKDISYGIAILNTKDEKKVQMVPIYNNDDFEKIKERIIYRYETFLK